MPSASRQRSRRSTSSKPARATGGLRPTSSRRSRDAIPRCTSGCACISSKPAPRRARAQRGDARRRRRSPRLVSDRCPASFEGVLVANELLDAHAGHQVVMREDGLREIYVGPSTRRRRQPASRAKVRRRRRRWPTISIALGVTLEPGWRAEINLRAVSGSAMPRAGCGAGSSSSSTTGTRRASSTRSTHAAGTLTTFARHTMAGPESRRDAAVADAPGRAGHHRPRRLHERRGAPPKPKGWSRSGFSIRRTFLLGLARNHGSDSNREPRTSNAEAAPGAEDPADAGRPRQHDEGADSRQGVGTPALPVLVPRARHMNASALLGLALMIVSEAATLAGIEPFCVLEYADRLDRLHPLRRRRRLAGARQLVDSIVAARVRVPRAACRSRSGWCSSSTTCFIDNWYYVGLPGEPAAAVFRIRLVVRHDLAGDLRRRGLIAVLARTCAVASAARPASPLPAASCPSCPPASPLVVVDRDRRGDARVAAVVAVARIWRRRSGSDSSFCSIRSIARLGGESLVGGLPAGRSDRADEPDRSAASCAASCGSSGTTGRAPSGTTRCRSWST